MRLIRFRSLAHGGPQLGVLEEGRTDAPGSGGTTGGIGPVMALAGGPALSDLLALPLSDIREVCEKPSGERFSPEEIDEAAWMAIAFGGSPAMMFYRDNRYNR